MRTTINLTGAQLEALSRISRQRRLSRAELIRQAVDRYLAYQAFPHLIGVSIEGNRDLVKHIAVRDGDKAAKVMRELIEHSWRTVRSCVTDE